MSFTWGDELGNTEMYGRETDPSTYNQIDPQDEKLASFRHASHVFLFALTDKKALHLYPRTAIVLMQMRFDGYIGFPGGLVDDGENPAEAANREMVEELGWDGSVFGNVTQKDHMFTHADNAKKLALHFYAKQLSETDILNLEKRSTTAMEHGDESLGLIHVPLYTMGDGYRGFPSFLKNNFVGNARGQLIMTLIKLKLMTQGYVDEALKAQPKAPA